MANTPKFRGSYCHVFQPQKNDLNGEMEYSLVAIFPKGTDLSQMKADAQAAIEKKWGADPSKWPQNLRSPFRKCKERWKHVDGKEVIPAGYEDPDATFVTMKKQAKHGSPEVVDQNVQKIIEPNQFYSGAWAIASYNAYAYDNKGNRGAAIGLGNVQKIADGEPLGGRASASTEFSKVEGAAGSETKGAASIFDD